MYIITANINVYKGEIQLHNTFYYSFYYFMTDLYKI